MIIVDPKQLEEKIRTASNKTASFIVIGKQRYRAVVERGDKVKK